MVLFQLVLPLYDNTNTKLPQSLFTETLKELTDRFGGATAFTRSPAQGFWEEPGGQVQRDEVIVIEVMAEEAEDDWWSAYKQTLEARFRQETILIRAVPCRTI
jgi:hypothetical protein